MKIQEIDKLKQNDYKMGITITEAWRLDEETLEWVNLETGERVPFPEGLVT